MVIVDAGHPSKIKPSINRTSCSKLESIKINNK